MTLPLLQARSLRLNRCLALIAFSQPNPRAGTLILKKNRLRIDKISLAAELKLAGTTFSVRSILGDTYRIPKPKGLATNLSIIACCDGGKRLTNS